MNSFWDLMLASLIKDIRLEWRSKDALNSMLFFSLLVVVIFSFSFDPNAEESRQIAGGLVWVAFLFAAVVALNQTWAREIRNQVLDAYRVAPAPEQVWSARDVRFPACSWQSVRADRSGSGRSAPSTATAARA